MRALGSGTWDKASRRVMPPLYPKAAYRSSLLQELLSGKEGRKAEALVLARLRKDPYLATTVLPLPLPPGWREAAEEGARGDPRVPLFPELLAA